MKTQKMRKRKMNRIKAGEMDDIYLWLKTRSMQEVMTQQVMGDEELKEQRAQQDGQHCMACMT